MRATRAVVVVSVLGWLAACGDDSASSDGAGGSAASGNGANAGGSGGGILLGGDGVGASGAGGNTIPAGVFPELWYSVDDWLVLITLDPADGSVDSIQSSQLMVELELGQSALTMLDDGSLLVSRLGKASGESRLLHIPDPPRDGGDVTPTDLGVMPGGIMLEGLYTDCEGRAYGMDTGEDDSSAEGNRLLRFTGDVTAGDFAFAVVSDLATADVADIDDMGPGISGNQITDNPGLAIDSGDVYAFNYETGSGTQVAEAGTWGIHALGGALFDDGRSRLYVLSSDAELFEVDPGDFSLSEVLGTGPTPGEGNAGWSSLAGPLTDCETGFTPPK